MLKSNPSYLGIAGKILPSACGLGQILEDLGQDFFQNSSDRGWISYQSHPVHTAHIRMILTLSLQCLCEQLGLQKMTLETPCKKVILPCHPAIAPLEQNRSENSVNEWEIRTLCSISSRRSFSPLPQSHLSMFVQISFFLHSLFFAMVSL